MPDAVRANLKRVNELAASIDTLTHYDLMGVGKDADQGAIRQAFRKLARDLHVDRFRPFQLDDEVMERVQQVFIAINKANEVLSDPAERKEYDVALEMKAKGGAAAKLAAKGGGPNIADVFRAEKLVREGLNLLKNAKGQAALERLTEALEITPEDMLGQAGHAYAEFLVIQSKGSSPTAVGRAKERLLQITAEFDSREEPWLFLGRLHKLQDNMEKAAEAFRNALKANPHCVEAKSELRHVQRKTQPAQRKGLFGRRKS